MEGTMDEAIAIKQHQKRLLHSPIIAEREVTQKGKEFVALVKDGRFQICAVLIV